MNATPDTQTDQNEATMPDPTAEQILTVLNDGEPVDYSTLEWCVITGYQPGGTRDNCWPFDLGELIVLNENGREPFGEGRKPGKWSVLEFSTRDYEQASALSVLIKGGAVRGWWNWDGTAWVRNAGDVGQRNDRMAWVGAAASDDEQRAGWTQ